MEPELLHSQERIQLSYNLPHQVHDLCVYPRLSPEGSRIVIYGHETGIRILWYDTKIKASNGMTQESQNDDETSNPYGAVSTFVDIPLDSAVHHLDAPPVSSSSDQSPTVLEDNLVVVVACADLSVQVVLFPLHVPVKADAEDARVLKITRSHRDLISAVAVTYASSNADQEVAGSGSRSRSRARTSATSNQESVQTSSWSLLVASASATGNGLLTTHQVFLGQNLSDDAFECLALEKIWLRSPLPRACLSFSTSTYSRMPSLLLALPNVGAVKVFRILARPASKKQRRGSASTTGSSVSAVAASQPTFTINKSCLTMHTPVVDVGLDAEPPRRKRILDAQWILDGQGVIVLLDDGDWGVWDLEGALRNTSGGSQNLLHGHSQTPSLKGGATTRFTLAGKLTPPAGASNRSRSSKDTDVVSTSSLAPMTPHTRKIRSEGFLKGQKSQLDTSTLSPVGAFGTVFVLSQRSGPQNAGKSHDDVVVMNHAMTNYMIPSIQACWKSEQSDGGSLSTAGTSRPQVLPTIQLGGELQRKLCLFPAGGDRGTAASFTSPSLVPEFIVCAQTRLLVSVPSRDQAASSGTSLLNLSLRPMGDRILDPDQALLEQQELDIDGMDRLLDGMQGRDQERDVVMSNPRKSVGFRFQDEDEDEDEDEDVSMGTPTTSRTSRSKLVINKGTTSGGNKQLFT